MSLFHLFCLSLSPRLFDLFFLLLPSYDGMSQNELQEAVLGGCVRLASSNACCRKLVLASFFDHHLFHAVKVATLVKPIAGWIPAPPSCTAASIRLARTHSLENQDINSRSNTSLSSTKAHPIYPFSPCAHTIIIGIITLIARNIY